jgi:hypothetical protein
VISEYLESLEGKLGFDRSLARCVRQEVEDHLWEAVAADASGDPVEAERRAIANFGDPQLIAAHIAAVSLARQSKKVAISVVLVIAGVFLAMKARLAWYSLTRWALSDEMRAAAAILGAIDRYAFWLSVFVGLAGWAYLYIGSRRPPGTFHPSYGRQLRRFFVLSTIATAGLAVVVISDGVLTALRLVETQWSADFLIPVFSMAVEVVCAAVLAFHIRSIVRRAASAAALLQREQLQ